MRRKRGRTDTLRDILTLSALILAVFLVRAAFKNRVPKRMLYGLWLVVLLKLCLPGTLFSLPLLPAEEETAPAKTAQTMPVSAQPTAPAQTVSQPAPKPETQEPVTQPTVQEPEKPAAKPLTTAQILKIVWAAGSGLLGLWLLGTWAVFTIRLYRDRRFLGKRGRTRIYVSNCVKSPCLAGLIPAVYLTQDVLQTDDTELIVRHELTHLRHLDFLWSFCRTAAVTVYWWNPLVWLAAILSKRDAELACDEAVAARLSPERRIAYARAILAQAPRKAAALSLAGPPVKERILFLTKKQKTSVLCIVLALLLTISATGCSFAELTQRERKPVSLTKRQIDEINVYFDGEQQELLGADGHFGVNGFFTSTYDDVRDLNLKEFLKYFREGAEEDIREDEFARLKEIWPQYAEVPTVSDMPVPITRYPASNVEAVLQKFAGIGLRDLRDVREPFSGYAYLEETDAFYTTTSDYAPGFFVCASGTVLGDTATLLEEDGARVLTLKHEGEQWYIHSFTLGIPADAEAAHQEPLKDELKSATPLTQEQIDAVNAVFADYALSTDDTLGHFAVNGFFTSTYDDVRDLNLSSFLEYFGECSEDDITEEEFAQLNAKWGFRVDSVTDSPLPIHRYPASAVESVLQRFAGIGLADLKDMQEPFSDYTYLEETDAFYNTTSDYSPGAFICTGGSIDAFGEYVELIGWASCFSGESILRLIKDGENWYIHSFTLEIPADESPAGEPTFTPLLNDGTYDVTKPLQDWELTRTNGVQTGMTQAQVEAITGSLTPDEYGNALLDDQNISYYFRQNGYREPQLMKMRWSADVRSDELFYQTAQDAPSFRGICLGDTIDEVFDKFPCVDRELKRWQTQYVYGYEGADNYAVLSLIADSFYILNFTVNGQWRAEIDFSRVQQRVFEIVIYSETYWQDINQEEEADTSFLRDSALREAITSDLSELPNSDFLAFIMGTEDVQPDDAFTFNDPSELSSDELFRLFLWWTDRSVLEEYQNPDDGLFYFPSSVIYRTLDCYFRRYSFDITQCAGYDAESGTVVAQTLYLEARIQDVWMQMVSKTTDGHKVTYVVDSYPVLDGPRVGQEPVSRKEYTFLCYPGDFYVESARYVPLDDAAQA